VHGDISTIQIVFPFVETEVSVSSSTEEVEQDIVIGLYSGLAYNITPIDIGENATFEDFNPTSVTRESFPTHFTQGLSYQEVSRLGVYPHPDIQPAGNMYDYGPSPGDGQTDVVHPCMYSGALAEVVSVALGMGNLNLSAAERVALLPPNTASSFSSRVSSQGFQIQYGWEWQRHHGLVKSEQDTWWLVEISELNGIIARPLPLLTANAIVSDEESEAFINKYGGLPSGEAFSASRGSIVAGIADGWIKELMSPSDFLSAFYADQSTYADSIGWCFDPDGHEARVATFQQEHANGWTEAVYWRMSFGINEETDVYFAALEIIRTDIVAEGRSNGGAASGWGGGGGNLFVYLPGSDAHAATNIGAHANSLYTSYWGDLPELMEGVIWVGWINGGWHEIYYRCPKVVEFPRVIRQPTLPSIDFIGRIPWEDAEGRWFHPGAAYSSAFYTDSYRWWSYEEFSYYAVVESATMWHAPWVSPSPHQGWGSSGPAYAYIWYDANGRSPSLSTQFVLCAYNRNAYYVEDRQELGSGVVTTQYGTEIVEPQLTLAGGSKAVQMATPITPVAAGTPVRSTDSIFTGSWSSGAGGSLIKPTGTDYDVNIFTASGPCLSPPSLDYINWIRSISVTETTPFAGQVTKYFKFPQQYSGNYPSLCEDMTAMPTPTGPSTTPVVSSGNSQSRPYPGGNFREQPETWRLQTVLVATVGGGQPIVFPAVTDENTYNQLAGGYGDLWCQTAVLGKPAAIYGVGDQLDPDAGFGDRAYTSTGIHPSLPDTDPDTQEYKKLTFVGINGPSSP
jgi:hypothetical protein